MKKNYISFVALILVATLTTSCLRARLATRRTSQEQPASVEIKQDNTVSKVRKPQSAARFDIPAPLLDRAEKILVRKAYTVSYDVSAPRATYSDYRDGGWSKGHMCPAGDNKWDSEAMYDTFLLTNICPQDYTLNSGYWNSVEMRCRHWAERYGSVLIVCGPILEGDHHDTIGSNHIVVPEAFFKVVVTLNDEPKGVGFICPNTDEHLSDEQCMTSISEVERITGITFFPHLNKEVSKRVKEEVSKF